MPVVSVKAGFLESKNAENGGSSEEDAAWDVKFSN